MEYDKELDCIGVYCPLPVIKTKQEMEGMERDDVLKVTADDPGSKEDFPAWCDATGNMLVGKEEKDGEFVFYIKKM